MLPFLISPCCSMRIWITGHPGQKEGRQDGRTDGRTDSPCVLQDFVPFGAAALLPLDLNCTLLKQGTGTADHLLPLGCYSTMQLITFVKNLSQDIKIIYMVGPLLLKTRLCLIKYHPQIYPQVWQKEEEIYWTERTIWKDRKKQSQDVRSASKSIIHPRVWTFFDSRRRR